MGVFYAYKGLLLLFGMYMAWETRRVKIPVLNDSQYIGMNIYNVVLMSVTVVALSNILNDRPTLSYAVVSALIWFSTTSMLCLLFLPKVSRPLLASGVPCRFLSETGEFEDKYTSVQGQAQLWSLFVSLTSSARLCIDYVQSFFTTLPVPAFLQPSSLSLSLSISLCLFSPFFVSFLSTRTAHVLSNCWLHLDRLP